MRNGILVCKTNGKTATQITQEQVQNYSVVALFEAMAEAGPFVAKADILQAEGNGWHILEVKSSFSDTKSISDLVDDLAYTVMIRKLLNTSPNFASVECGESQLQTPFRMAAIEWS